VGEDAGVVACRGKWDRLKQASQQSALLSSSSVTPSDVRIAPLIQSLWSQSTVHTSVACYNYYTPPYEPGNASNYVAGCVATALAQLMRYYQCPSTSVGTNSFSITVDGTTNMSRLRGGDGVGGPYSWADMPNVPISPNTIQCQAIGALLYDAGISSHMDYTAKSSGATLNDAASALEKVFHFRKAVYGGNGSALGAALTAMINPNLDARRPVILGILGAVPGGHAVVCDGYGYSVSTLYHHLNMGWAGTDNAWYALPTILTGLGTFDTIQDCIYNAFTNGTGEIISGRVVDGGGLPVEGAAVSAVRSAPPHTYLATTDTNGIYALIELPSRANFTINVAKTGYYTATKSASTSLSANYGANSGNVWGLDFNLNMMPVTLSLKADPVQAGTVSGGGEFVPGTLNQIEATAAAGWFFYRWQDDVRLNPRTVTIPASNVIYTASFVQPSKLSRLIASNSILTMSIQGTPGGVNRIDYSTNLVQWQPLATNLTNIEGTIYFTDMIGSHSPNRFYRAVIP
jgi:Peptidase C10 family/Carboxypeptidase regulatory-like domain/Divergent InlB B-repeat domain